MAGISEADEFTTTREKVETPKQDANVDCYRLLRLGGGLLHGIITALADCYERL